MKFSVEVLGRVPHGYTVRKPPASGATVFTAVTLIVATVVPFEAERVSAKIGTTRSLELADRVPITDAERVSATRVG